MKHLTCLYTSGGEVSALAAVTELSDGRLNVCVVTTNAGSRMEPGNWSLTQAQGVAHEWVEGLIGKNAAVPSRWAESNVVP